MSDRDASCIFCKIAAGEIHAAKIHEDDDCLAFLDINPLAEGHALLIPKRHFETIYEMPTETVVTIARLLPALGRAVRRAVNAEGLNILQNNGLCSGQAVMHVHFHLIPRIGGDALGYRWPVGTYREGRLEEVRSMVAETFANEKG